jgi:nucleotide-binding universal stress UspA family protein
LAGGVDAWKRAGYPLVDRGPVSSLFGRILVPLDASEASEAVLYQAERLLCGRKSEVILFHAWNPVSSPFANPEAADLYLTGIQRRLSAGGAQVVRRLVKSGPLAQTLPEAVASESPSLIAISSHGRETSPREPVAGTFQDVLLDSRVPVFVARAFRREGDGEPVPAECEAPSIRRILVPLDGSSACEAVMPYAGELARLLAARIIILHVSAQGSAEPGSVWGRDLSEAPLGPAPGADATPDQRIEYAARTFASAGVETLALNLAGDPISTILDFARPSAVDLIAMTTHGWTGLSKLLIGSVAEKVFREAMLPTLLVRSDAEEAVRYAPLHGGHGEQLPRGAQPLNPPRLREGQRLG